MPGLEVVEVALPAWSLPVAVPHHTKDDGPTPNMRAVLVAGPGSGVRGVVQPCLDAYDVRVVPDFGIRSTRYVGCVVMCVDELNASTAASIEELTWRYPISRALLVLPLHAKNLRALAAQPTWSRV